MRQQQPTTQTMKISDVKNTLSSLVNRVYRKEARVLVEKSGIPVAAIVSAEDLKQLARLDAQRVERRQLVEAMRDPFRGVPPDELECEGERAIAAVRATKRAERERVNATATRP